MAPQDSFIEDEEDTCPLCVEEFDLSDKNFRPCPCGYQVCQFCFNNIKNNMNGLCPACRRPYDEKTIQWKVVTQEEIAQFKANIQKNAKKKAEQRQKEAQKREVETLNRKHLAGLRVIQKNLVYVVGLSPGIREEEMLQTLRGDKYFGQYGKIIKIVVQKPKQGEPQNGQSIGVYVTFEKKEDAARCIAAVNGSQNGERVLRAQLGTTKYCSAYLRNETCTNKQCMFLHEPGDNDDSYSRQDLSSINSVNTQRPLSTVASSSRSSSRQAIGTQAPIQQAQAVAAASQPMARGISKDGSDSGDGSALPSSASWANQGTQQRSRRGSHATSGAASSPAISHAMPATTEAIEDSSSIPEPLDSASVSDTPPAPASVEPSRPPRNTALIGILKAINDPSITFPKIDPVDTQDLAFPPLFDEHGGEKRRAMREQQEEARLHMEEEPVLDQHPAPEPAEEEEPESGSLQLGGEPEDREPGRDGGSAQGFRRMSSQMPIQRAATNGPFGPNLTQNFPQNVGNLSSINGRTLTPQQQHQLALLKGGQQQSFMEQQYPPGTSQSSTLFQQQSHNRQSSRYSFANESSASSSSVKPAANPKLMAQQSSMMPSGSHTQQNNQYYGSSMPGPPPGLKSTGTPPIGMFGQGFGGSAASSVFGGSQKENNSDMLREMLRSRGGIGTGNSQVHDTGKREYMFPSFLQQYPSTSSTPAPASNLLASLYGPQPGAFHDFPKQKKKGKKHRHANTSSSGGGGLVDLADPSILQARMQHQQQSNAGVGQGLFGGQAQDDLDLPSLDEASKTVDQLVADSTADDTSSYVYDPFEVVSRSSTPSIPPGFGPPGLGPPGLALPHAHPSPLLRENPIAKPASRIAPNAAPFTPSRTSSSAFAPRAATPLSTVSLPQSPVERIATPKLADNAKAQAKKDIKALATDTGLSKTIAAEASAGAGPKVSLQSEDFPALTKGASKQANVSKPSTPVKASKKPATTSVATGSASTSQTPVKASQKVSTPGILNISVPTKPSSKVATPAPDPALAAASVPNVTQEMLVKPAVAPAAFPPLPSTASVHSPIPRNPPKTLRVIPTPRTELPPGSGTPSSATSMFPPILPSSRQPSLASTTRLERPGTPMSEIISETASITSASISRANSPPLSKVGSAPVRITTKSMQKKQRREAQKEREAKQAEAVVQPEPEVEIAPIMGRKKKQKKEKQTGSAAGGSTPAISRAPSPGHAEIPKEVEPTPELEAQAPAKPPPVEKEANKVVSKPLESRGKGKAKAQRPLTPEPVSMVTEVEEESTEKPVPTPSAILQELVGEGVFPDPASLPVLKPPPGLNSRHELTLDMQDIDQKLTIHPEDRSSLIAGVPVWKITEGAGRIMLTPNGDCVRNLTSEEERRFLHLQAKIAEESGPTAFFSAKHHTSNGFTLIGGRAVPNGPPAFFPMISGSIPPIDPVSKIQRDEALSYINQYVLPSLSTNSQLEKALNANAFDAEMMRNNGSSSSAFWGSEAVAPGSEPNEGPYGPNSHEGILATGLENMTAHFAVSKEIERGQPLGNVSLLSLSESETAMQMARKETETLEKKLNQLLKKNRRLLLGTGH
ncbi:hypothetical protein BP6252_06365 [Coleophoma cylindrospora]|uniref:General negative regulator of transcription subunit 4 n=1 Tax=Coleophoma cylindrospora TaxID=1849047 RepID=A0A3D8RME4_9HELO|nr:hypothetical protein BP6252_06365 [Coleophoma cylindrospora]